MSAPQLAGQRICNFTYNNTFCDVSPSWSLLLGYSAEALSEMKLENFLANIVDDEVLKAMSVALSTDVSGSVNCKTSVNTSGGYVVQGYMVVEWFGVADKIFHCSFVYTEDNPVIENNLVYQYMSEVSMSGTIKYDEYSNIMYADGVFETFFNMINATGAKTYSFAGNQSFALFLKSVSENDHSCCIDIGTDKLIVVIDKKDGITTARVYNKQYLMSFSNKDDITLILNRKRLWDKLPMMFLVDAENGLILDANPAASELYGYRLDEFRHMPLSNISTLPRDILNQEAALALSEKKTYFVSRHRMANGQIKDISFTTSVITVGQKKYVLAFLSDVTRRKNLEKVIEEKNRSLADLNLNLSKMVQDHQREGRRKEELFLRQSKLAAVGEMVSAIADYWKEPLNTIGLLVQDMEDAEKFGELDGKYIENTVRAIMRHLENTSSSIDTCVKFFKHDNGTEIFDVRNVILNITKVLDHRFGDANVTICIDCFCGRPCGGFDDNGACIGGYIDVLGCVNEFKHAFCNVLINSLEAIANARKTGILLDDDEGLIFINVKTDGSIVSISVIDNGGGIEEESSDKVFEPYFSTKEDGMGIGLYITKQLIEKNMSGRIVFSNVRDGCDVTISLPCIQTSLTES